MKNLNFWRSTALPAMILLATGCAAGKPSKIIEERIAPPKTSATPSDTATTGMAPEAAGEPKERSPGMVVHIDPNTGEFLPGASPGALTPPATPGVSAGPAPQLLEVPSPVPGGGVLMDLQGQFLTPLEATSDVDGKIRLKHKPVSR